MSFFGEDLVVHGTGEEVVGSGDGPSWLVSIVVGAKISNLLARVLAGLRDHLNWWDNRSGLLSGLALLSMLADDRSSSSWRNATDLDKAYGIVLLIERSEHKRSFVTKSCSQSIKFGLRIADGPISLCLVTHDRSAHRFLLLVWFDIELSSSWARSVKRDLVKLVDNLA